MRSYLVIFLIFSLVLPVHAHEGRRHDSPTSATSAGKTEDPRIIEISSAYNSRIKPLFQKACFDCHSDQPVYPWYYKVPGVKQLIDSDIAEAKTHLDLSPGFPFKGHGSPAEDLAAISDSIKSGSMPPFLYRMMHSSQKLSEAEQQIVLDWARDSSALLNEP